MDVRFLWVCMPAVKVWFMTRRRLRRHVQRTYCRVREWWRSARTSKTKCVGLFVRFGFVALVQFENFCKVIGKTNLSNKEEVRNRWPVPATSDRDWILREVANAIATRPLQHWIDLCVENDIPCAPISGYSDLVNKDDSVGRHMYDNDYIVDVKHRDYGDLRWVGVPTRFSDTPNKHRPNEGESWHAPYIGEHNVETLVNICGFTEDEANELLEEEVIPEATGPRAIKNSLAARKK